MPRPPRDLALRTALLASLLPSACFDPPLKIDSTGTEGATMGTTTGGSVSDTLPDPTSPGSATTGSGTSPTDTDDETDTTDGREPPDFDEGDPPDLGDPGPEGQGEILVVHAMQPAQSELDVWLVGTREPAQVGLMRDSAVVLDEVPRGVHRVVLTRPDSLEVVGCSDWFLLRRAERWATVASRSPHDCLDSTNGATLTFQQATPVDANPVRIVHAAAEDPMTVSVGGTPQPGPLDPRTTASAPALTDCSGGGCTVRYAFSAIDRSRAFTYAVRDVQDIPGPGEVLFVVQGNIRQEWPAEGDALRLLAVDRAGIVQVIERDPELSFVSLMQSPSGETRLYVPAIPSGLTELEALRFDASEGTTGSVSLSPGPITLLARSLTNQGSPARETQDTLQLEDGHRYVLFAGTSPDGGGLELIDDGLARNEPQAALARAYKLPGDDAPDHLVRAFGEQLIPFDSWTNLDMGELSPLPGESLPTADGGWNLRTSVDGTNYSCNYFMTTPAGYRGLFMFADGIIFEVATTTWPPSMRPVSQFCI